MKSALWLTALTTFVNLAPSGSALDDSISTTSMNIWKEGKVPYEIAKQFGDRESTLIKESMVELMKTTCVQFIPRFNNEADYIVFMKYKQENGACWSGKWIDGINSTIGNKKGRHIFSLWPDFACFNKFDIMRGLINILSVQTKSIIRDGNNNKNKKQIFYALFGGKTYEDNFGLFPHNRFLKTSCKNDAVVLKKHPFALDNEEMMQAAIRDSCSVLRKILEINQLYHCPLTSASSAKEFVHMDATNLASIAPNCLAEATAGTCKTDQIYMSVVCDKSFCDVAKQKPSTAHLRNALGRFLATFGNLEGNGIGLIPWGYLGDEKGQQWSWNQDILGSKNRHICNGHRKCAASPENNPSRTRLIQWESFDEAGQKYQFHDSSRTGFYIIMNDFGNCLGVNAAGKEIVVDSCNSTDNGQHWQWYKI